MPEFDWGSYDYKTEGGAYMKEEDVILSIAMGKTFLVTGIRDDDSNTYNNKPKPRWLVDLIDEEGEEKTRSISKGVPERDTRLKRLQETIAASGEPIKVRFTKVGRAYDLTGA